MKNINSRIGYIIVLTFWLVILMSLSTCSKKTHVITEWDGNRKINWYSTDKKD